MKRILPILIALALTGCAGTSNDNSKAESKADTSAVNESAENTEPESVNERVTTAEQNSSEVPQDLPDGTKEISDEKMTAGVIKDAVYDNNVMYYDYMVDSAEEYELFKGLGGNVPEFSSIDFDKYTLFAKTGASSRGDEYIIDKVLVSGEIVMLNIKKTAVGSTDDSIKRWFYAVIPKKDLPEKIKGWKRPSETDLTPAGASQVIAYIETDSFDAAGYDAVLKKYGAYQAMVNYMNSGSLILLSFITESSDINGINQDIESTFTVRKAENGESLISADKIDAPAAAYKNENGSVPENYDSGKILVSIQCTEPSRQYNEAADYIEEAFGVTEWIGSPKDNCIEGSFERDNFPAEKLQSGIAALHDVSSKYDIKLNGFSLRYNYN